MLSVPALSAHHSVLTTDGLVPCLSCVFSKITKYMHIPTSFFVFVFFYLVDEIPSDSCGHGTFDVQLGLFGPVQYQTAGICCCLCHGRH